MVMSHYILLDGGIQVHEVFVTKLGRWLAAYHYATLIATMFTYKKPH